MGHHIDLITRYVYYNDHEGVDKLITSLHSQYYNPRRISGRLIPDYTYNNPVLYKCAYKYYHYIIIRPFSYTVAYYCTGLLNCFYYHYYFFSVVSKVKKGLHVVQREFIIILLGWSYH